MKHSNVSYSDMCQSMNFNAHEVSSDCASTSEYKVNIIGFRHLPRCLSKEFSDINDSFSIDEFNSNSHKHPEVFKCFKCYGKAQNKQIQALRKCRQCQGTSFVTDSHPLVSILEQIISKEVPELALKQQNSKKRKLNRKQTIEKQYACPDTIKQESFSMQQDQVPTCRSCQKQCEPNYHKCDICPNYYICSQCFTKNNFYHHHRLYPKEVSMMMVGNLNPCYTLKKISQQVSCLQVSNLVEDTSSKCNNCRKKVQTCFICCMTCSAKGIQYILCDGCYQEKIYSHQPNHQLNIKTSFYDQQVDLDPHNNSLIDFQNSPLFRSQDNISIKSKEPSSFNNCFVPFEQQIGEHASQIMVKASMSEESMFQNDLQELSNMNIMRCKLSKSYRSQKEQQELDMSIRFSQHRPQSEQNKISEIQIPKQPQAKSLNEEQQVRRESSFILKNSRTQKTNPQEYVFKDYQCDICGVSPIINRKYHCNQCEDYDLCEVCYLENSQQHEHKNFVLDDGSQLLKKQRNFLAKNIHQKLNGSSIALMKISNNFTQSKQIKTRIA